MCLAHVAHDDGWRIIMDVAPSPLLAHNADDTHRLATESAVDAVPAALRAASVMTRRSMIRSTLDRCARTTRGADWLWVRASSMASLLGELGKTLNSDKYLTVCSYQGSTVPFRTRKTHTSTITRIAK